MGWLRCIRYSIILGRSTGIFFGGLGLVEAGRVVAVHAESSE